VNIAPGWMRFEAALHVYGIFRHQHAWRINVANRLYLATYDAIAPIDLASPISRGDDYTRPLSWNYLAPCAASARGVVLNASGCLMLMAQRVAGAIKRLSRRSHYTIARHRRRQRLTGNAYLLCRCAPPLPRGRQA